MEKNRAREISFALRAAKRNKERAYLQASGVYEEYRRLAGRHLDVDFSFPKMEEGLHQLQSCIDDVFLYQEELHRIAHTVERAKDNAATIQKQGRVCAEVIKTVGLLRSQGEYQAAIALLKQNQIKKAQCTFKFAKTYAEVASNLLVSSYHDLAEQRIQQGLIPLNNDELKAYQEAIDAFYLGLHSKKEKAHFQDHIRGLHFYIEAMKLDSLELSPDNIAYFQEVFAMYSQHAFGCSKRTLWRYSLFRSAFCKQFNKACYRYFDEAPEYKDALFFFQHRDMVPSEYLEHPCYKASKDENEFRSAFLTEDMLRKEDADFALELQAILQTVKEAHDIPSQSIALLFCHPKVNDERHKMILKVSESGTFSQKIFIVESCLTPNMEQTLKHDLLQLLYVPKKRRKCDLEAVADSLLNISKHIGHEDKEAFDKLIASLYRSFKAHSICRKSQVEAVRTLAKKQY